MKVARSFVHKVRRELKASDGNVENIDKRKKHEARFQTELELWKNVKNMDTGNNDDTSLHRSLFINNIRGCYTCLMARDTAKYNRKVTLSGNTRWLRIKTHGNMPSYESVYVDREGAKYE